MAFVSSLVCSTTSAVLIALQSFLVSTCAWTLIDTGVSGLADNFVVKSSGVSGDRSIMLKFGVSTLTEGWISCFACVSFASATDVASNATTERNVMTNSGAAITIWMEGDQDHVFLGTNRVAAATQPSWLYAGLTQELHPVGGVTPNQAVVICGLDLQVAVGRVVEGPAGTFNAVVNAQVFNVNAVNKTDPNLLDGLVYLFPIIIDYNASDRLLGTLKNLYHVGQAVASLAVLTASGVDYTVFNGTNAGGTVTMIAVKMA